MSLSFILALFWFFPFNWYTSCNNDVQNDVYIVKLLRPCKTGNFTLPLHLNEEYKYWGMNVSVPLTIFKILPYYLPACGFTLKSPMAVLLLLIFLSVFHCHDGIYSVKLWVFSILLIFLLTKIAVQNWNMYNIMYETSRQSRFDARYWMLGAGALGWPSGWVWGGRRVEGSGWGTQVYLWRIHFDTWQN